MPLSIVLLGLMLRLFFVYQNPRGSLYGDQIGYYRNASTLAHEGEFAEGPRIRAPLYRIFLAGVIRLVGDEYTGIRYFQAALSLITLTLAWFLARCYLSTRAATAALLILAVHPQAISMPFYLLSEVLFTPLLLLALWASKPVVEGRASPARTAAAGAAWGLAALTRAVATAFLPLLVIAAYFANRSRPRALTRTLVLPVSYLALLSPWISVNYAQHHTFVLSSTDASFNVWWRGLKVGRSPLTMKEFSDSVYTAIPDLTERTDVAFREGIRGILAHRTRFLSGSIRRFRKLWLHASLPRNAAHGWNYPRTSVDWYTRLLARVALPYHLALVAMMLVGIVLHRHRSSWWLLSGFVVYLTLVHSLLASLERYRFPLIGVMAILAVSVFERRRNGRHPRSRG